jgi:Peptidase family M23
MIVRLKWIILFPIVVIFGWLGWTSYNYFFDTTAPHITVRGLEPSLSYAGDISCVVTGKDGYKVADISVLLDGKPLVNNHKIEKKQFEYNFTLATRALNNGKHTLKIIVKDSSSARNQTTEELTFYVDNIPLQASFVKAEVDGRVFQGRTLHIQFQTNKDIKAASAHVFSEKYPCVPEAKNSLVYECFIPVKSEEIPNEYMLSLEISDHVENTVLLEHKFNVIMYPFKKQNITLNQEKVKAEDELGLPAAQLEADIEAATLSSPHKKLWHGLFYIPIEMKGISTEFGTMRTTQQRGKYPHNAVDLLGDPKGVVWASQDGIVAIKQRYAHSGNTIGIDHGLGILTLYFHLESMSNIQVGQPIKKGNPLGTIGNTGYATGPHLHLEMRISNIPVDPLQWTRSDF